MNLKNRTIVITGASKGLGKALALALVNEGSRVLISARSLKELKAAASEIGATYFQADVTKEKEVRQLARFAKQQFGRVDMWINNAGTTLPHSTIDEIDIKAAHQVFEINFFGTFYGTREAIAIMKNKGVILNIVSMSALVGRPRSLIYASSKWAVRGFTESIRMALKHGNISVLAVHPGGMKTTIFGKHLPKGYEDWMEPSFVAKKIVQNLKRAKPKEEIVIDQ
jgi:NAD(P)-dependent dehydrogenase (short-subunit alcohol dehydrogenase family)